MSLKIRRVVTAEKNGKSVISSDASAPSVHELGGGMVVADIWKALETPVNLLRQEDNPEAGELALPPPRNGNVLRIAEFPPEPKDGISSEDAKNMFEQMSAGETSTGDAEDARSAMMHKTDSLDYGIVLEGEITMLVDEGEVTLGPGDIVIQRGTNHGWINRSQTPCRMLFVLTDGTR